MTNIKFAGFPNTPVDLDVNGVTATLTPSELSGPPAGQTAKYASRDVLNADYLGMGLNFRRFSSGRLSPNNAPGIKCMTGKIARAGTTGSTFVGPLGAQDYYRGDAFVGARVSVLRVVDGVEQVWDATVSACQIDVTKTPYYILTQSSGAFWEDTKCVASPSALVRFGNWVLGRTYHLGIAAVESNGKTGPFTYASMGVISVTGSNNGAGVTNTLVTMGTRDDGASVTLAAPTGVSVSELSTGLWEITCDAVSGAFGYVISVIDVDPADVVYPSEYNLTLTGDDGFSMEAEKCQAIMMYEIMEPRYENVHFRTVPNQVGIFQYASEDGWARALTATNGFDWHRFNDTDDLPPVDGLVYYMRCRLHSGGVANTVRFSESWLGPATETYYEPWVSGRVYTVKFRFRGSASGSFYIRPVSSINVTMSINGAAATVATIFTKSCTTSWEEITLEFSANTEPPSVRNFNIEQVNGTQIDIDFADWRMSWVDVPAYGVNAFWDSKLLPGMLIRDQSGIFEYSGDDLTNIDGQRNYGRGTFKTVMEYCEAKGTVAWLMPAFWSPKDVLQNNIAYLCAPVSSGHPMALKRQSHGRTAPWTDDVIITPELANEPWNSPGGYIGPEVSGYSMKDVTTGEVILPGACFGYWCAWHMKDWDAEIPGYTEARAAGKIINFVAGRMGSNYGSLAAEVLIDRLGAGAVDAITVAEYFGGDNVARTTSGKGWATVAADGIAVQRELYMLREAEADALDLQLVVYEGQTGYLAVGNRGKFATVTISQASPGVITWTDHNFLPGFELIFTTTGALPTGLSVNTVYFVKTVLSANTFTVAATKGGTAINTSSAGSGAHTGSTLATADIADECIAKSRAAGSGTLDGIYQVGDDNGMAFGYFDALTGNKWSVGARDSEGGGNWIGYDAAIKIQEELGAIEMITLNDLQEIEVDIIIDAGSYTVPAFGVHWMRSKANPANKALVICPRDIDRSLLDTTDPYYDGGYVVPSELTIFTAIVAADEVLKLDYRGDFREHNRYPAGFKRNAVTGAYDVADALCVDIDEDWTDASSEFPNLQKLEITNMVGGPLVLLFKGVT